jgi:hypothetical protein
MSTILGTLHCLLEYVRVFLFPIYTKAQLYSPGVFLVKLSLKLDNFEKAAQR